MSDNSFFYGVEIEAANHGVSLPLEGSPDLGDRVFESEPMQYDCKEKMTYTEQAAKRKHCQRLTRYHFLCSV